MFPNPKLSEHLLFYFLEGANSSDSIIITEYLKDIGVIEFKQADTNLGWNEGHSGFNTRAN